MRFDKSTSGLDFESQKQVKQQIKPEQPGIYCKACHNHVTDPSHAVEINGAFRFVFSNPDGISFEIGMYDQADCPAISPPIYEHTWFAGFAWQIVVCDYCKQHLGWSYSRTDSPDFYGLILDRLVQVDK
jgi:hypothetical protein